MCIMTLARLLGRASHSGGLGHTVFLSVFGFHSFGSSSFLPNFKNEPSFSGAKLFRVWLPRTENFLHHILKRSQYIYYLQEIWMFIDCQNISKVQTVECFLSRENSRTTSTAWSDGFQAISKLLKEGLQLSKHFQTSACCEGFISIFESWVLAIKTVPNILDSLA